MKLPPERWLPRMTAVLVLLCASFDSFAESESSISTRAVADEIRERVEWLMFQDIQKISGERILAPELIAELYASVDDEPLWHSRQQIDELWDVAEVAYAEGLDPDDYPLAALRALLPQNGGLPDNPVKRANIDLLATEALLRMGYQLRFGKVNPSRLFAEWNFDRALREGDDRAASIIAVIRSESLSDAVNAITARGPIFEGLIAVLAQLRTKETEGGWPTVSAGPVLREGESGSRIVELRRRLDGRVDADEAGSRQFDAPLATAVRDFQTRHGLDADGVVGSKTIAALNVPVQQRILQVRASIERARWVFEDYKSLDGPVVLVNIASARVSLLRGTGVIWESRAQVGKPYRQTPVFRGDMQYLDFNPTWTVPPTILRKDVLPRLRSEGPDYLAEKNMDLLDLNGNLVPLDDIDWPTLGRNGFPYMVRQRPGPWNALGLVKFIFPNSHFIFLHDTPSRGLFDYAERAFSSGCIRVERPFELAELLLDDAARWNQATIQDVLDDGGRKVVHLKETIPVYLLYWTAAIGEGGSIYFYQDIYGRDTVLFEAMDTEPEIDLAG